MKRREVIELDDGSTKERSVRPLWLFANGNVLRAKWLYHHERTGELAIVTIRMFVAILPVCSLLRAPQLVEGTIGIMPFLSPVPVPAVFPVIPLMVVPVVAVVVPPLVSFVPLSGILTTVVSKIVAGLDPHWGNKCHTQEK
jgi:hypothetical protein